MKYAKWISILMLMMIPAMASAQISGGQQITAQVPFTFVVADHVVPLGKCAIEPTDATGRVLVIRSPANIHLFATASVTENDKAAKAYTMVFHRYGNRYYLVGVKLENSRVTYSLKPSAFEKELLSQNVPAAEEILLASAK